MTQYLIRRMLFAIPTLIVISMVVYAILALSPSDPLSQFAANPAIPPSVRENIRHQMGLDLPWYIRYFRWLLSLLQGNWGYSFASKGPVTTLIWQRLPQTLWVVGLAYLLAVLIAIPIGIISAIKQYSIFDQVATTFAFIGFSVPTFFTGLLFILLFSLKLQWFPSIYKSTLHVTNFATFLEQIKQMA